MERNTELGSDTKRQFSEKAFRLFIERKESRRDKEKQKEWKGLLELQLQVTVTALRYIRILMKKG